MGEYSNKLQWTDCHNRRTHMNRHSDTFKGRGYPQTYYVRDVPWRDVNRRFYVDGKRWIRDRANPANDCLGDAPVPMLESEEHLRQVVLGIRVNALLRDLVAPHLPKTKGHHSYRLGKFDKVNWTLCDVLGAVGSACLREESEATSHRIKFDGDLKREKEGMQDFTSLALFVDDVERTLRDLYCDFETGPADNARCAIFSVMRTGTRGAPRGIWRELWAAEEVDYGWYGIGVCIGDATSSYGVKEAADEIARRAEKVRADPKAFSKYTVRFVRALDKHWPDLGNRRKNLSVKLSRSF